jgi:hypothetical protein
MLTSTTRSDPHAHQDPFRKQLDITLSHPVTNPLPRTHASRMFNISSLVTPHVDKDTLYPTSCRTRVL